LIVRKSVFALEPYEWEPSNQQIAARAGIDPRHVIRFDTNSSPYAPTTLLREILANLDDLHVNEYPDTSYFAIRKLLSQYCNVDPEQLTITNGADEGLDIAAKTFIDEGSNAVISVPTYSMYRIVAQVMGGHVREVLRKEDFSDDTEAILKAIDERTGIVFLCSPNNPTGNVASHETLEMILDRTDATVVVDEAYYEFCGESFADYTKKHENLVIVRTFSKAFGMAGARVGYLIAHKNSTELMSRVRPPNSLSVISLKLAEMSLENIGLMKEHVTKITAERERVAHALAKISGLSVLPTKTNFLLVRFRERTASEVYEELLRSGIVSRDVSKLPLLANILRFTIRTREHNDLLIDKIRSLE